MDNASFTLSSSHGCSDSTVGLIATVPFKQPPFLKKYRGLSVCSLPESFSEKSSQQFSLSSKDILEITIPEYFMFSVHVMHEVSRYLPYKVRRSCATHYEDRIFMVSMAGRHCGAGFAKWDN